MRKLTPCFWPGDGVNIEVWIHGYCAITWGSQAAILAVEFLITDSGSTLKMVMEMRGSMPFSVELDITSTDGLARQSVASQAAAGWRADA